MPSIAGRPPMILASIAILAVAILLPRRALAQYEGQSDSVAPYAIAAIVLPLPVADVVFICNDLAMAAQGERVSKPMAITETAVAAPQALVAGVFVIGTEKSPWPLTLYTLGMLGLTFHGIVSLMPPRTASPNLSPPPVSDPNRARIALFPTVLDDGSQRVPGLGAVGRF